MQAVLVFCMANAAGFPTTLDCVGQCDVVNQLSARWRSQVHSKLRQFKSRLAQLQHVYPEYVSDADPSLFLVNSTLDPLGTLIVAQLLATFQPCPSRAMDKWRSQFPLRARGCRLVNQDGQPLDAKRMQKLAS